MGVATTSLRQGKFETRFWHKVFEEEVGRVKGHFGPINTSVSFTSIERERLLMIYLVWQFTQPELLTLQEERTVLCECIILTRAISKPSHTETWRSRIEMQPITALLPVSPRSPKSLALHQRRPAQECYNKL